MSTVDGMLTLAAWIAALLYLIPPLSLLVARAQRDRPLWELALDLPLAVALDLLLLLTLARVMRLETAILVSRPLWVVATGVWAIRSRLRGVLRWPRALGKTEIVTVAFAIVVAVWLSTAFSRDCHSFDRGWHIPLATSVRGQLLPFQNVYEPGKTFAYHFTGDVLGATIQTLSGVTVHMTLALSMSHDLIFALIAACLALLLCWVGIRSPAVAVLVQLPLLAGPATLLSARPNDAGYNFINLLKLSFRPHTALALLLLIGLFGAVLVRLRSEDDPPPVWRTASVLVVMTALLAVTDEASIGLVGLSLGVTWIVFPQVVAERRLHGLGVLIAMLVTLVVANLLFHGALFAGVGQTVSWVPPRAPGYYRQPISLEAEVGQIVLVRDLFALGMLWFAGVMMIFRERGRMRLASFVFISCLLVLSVVGLTRIDLGERAVESHRFMTAALVLTTMAGLFWIAPSPGRRMTLGVPQTIALLAMGLAAMGSLDWLAREGAPGASKCTAPSLYFAVHDLFEVNCRQFAGAELGEEPATTYLDKSIAYAISGCRPVFTSGPPAPIVRSDRLDLPKGRRVQQWDTKIGRMLVELGALRDIDKNLLRRGEPLTAVCRQQTTDPVCAYALARKYCRPRGAVYVCTIPSNERTTVVSTADYRRVKPPPGQKSEEPLRDPDESH